MPIITPTAGKTDLALAATAAGDILMSAGPAGRPVVAVPGDDYSVPGAAETWTGVKTHAARVRFDWPGGAWTSGVFQSLSPPDAGVTPDFHFNLGSASPGLEPEDHLVYMGWGTDGYGNSADGVRPSWGIGFESAYYGNYSATVPQFEWHLQFTRPDTAQVVRSITATVLHDGSHCDLGLAGDQIHFRDHTGAEMITCSWPNMFIQAANAFTHATNNVRWMKQRMTTGVDASLLYLDGGNLVRIGESQSPAVKIVFDSPVATMLWDNPVDVQVKNNLGAVSSFLNIDTTNTTIIRPPGSTYLVNAAGKFTQLTSSGFNAYLRFDPGGTVIGQASTSDGTQKLAFYGGTPAVQPPGGPATADATWTTNNQLMLQTVYDAVWRTSLIKQTL